jgi:hypothetical protein
MKRIFTLFTVSLCLFASAFAQNSPLKILEKPMPELPENAAEYIFFTYYKENDPDLQSNAEMSSRSSPKYPKGKNFEGFSGKVSLTIRLRSDGKIEVDEIKGELPGEFKNQARETV